NLVRAFLHQRVYRCTRIAALYFDEDGSGWDRLIFGGQRLPLVGFLFLARLAVRSSVFFVEVGDTSERSGAGFAVRRRGRRLQFLFLRLSAQCNRVRFVVER